MTTLKTDAITAGVKSQESFLRALDAFQVYVGSSSVTLGSDDEGNLIVRPTSFQEEEIVS